jgi:hypothetical protein
MTCGRTACCVLTTICLFAAWPARAEDDLWIRGVYTGESPRPVSSELMEAWQEASAWAERTPGAFVLVGNGESMRPLYAPGAILVLRQVPYGELKRGQTVLYRSRENKVVAHVLVAHARDGWRAKGLGNRLHDLEPVHAGNLIGVVVRAYKPIGEPPMLRLANAR